jgi:hypothetical protein
MRRALNDRLFPRPVKERVRWITRRTGGRSIEQVAEALRSYLVGWREYFRLADTHKVFGELDQWLRHRLRAVHLKHWRRGRVIYRQGSLGITQRPYADLCAEERFKVAMAQQ